MSSPSRGYRAIPQADRNVQLMAMEQEGRLEAIGNALGSQGSLFWIGNIRQNQGKFVPAPAGQNVIFPQKFWRCVASPAAAVHHRRHG